MKAVDPDSQGPDLTGTPVERSLAAEPLQAIFAEVALADDVEQAVGTALSRLEPEPKPVWLVWRNGRLQRERASGQSEDLDAPLATLAVVWEASRQSPVVQQDRFIGVVLPQASPDPINGEVAERMLVLLFVDRLQAELFTERVASKPTLELFGRLLAALCYREIDQWISSCTRDILFTSQASRPADACQAVVEAIRTVTRFDGRCMILRVPAAPEPAGGEDGVLEVVTLLPSEGPRDQLAPVHQGAARPSVRWRLQLGARLTDTSGSSFFYAHLRRTNSRPPAIQTESYLIVEDGQDGAERLVVHRSYPAGDPSGDSFDADRPTSVVRALLLALHDEGLLAPGSCVVMPLFDSGTLLGFLVTSSPNDGAFSGRDAVRIWELGLLAVRPLSRERRLESDFALAKLILGDAAALTAASPVAGNRQLKELLTVLCERLRRVLRADSVVLLPYDHKRDELIDTGAAQAGPWSDVPRSRRPSPRGVVRAILRDSEVEWSISSSVERFDPDSFVGRHDVGRFCGTALRSASGAAVGVLICNWAKTPEQLVAADATEAGVAGASPRTTAGASASVELRRLREFGPIAAELLQRQIASSSLAQLQDELFDLYGQLLVKAGTAFAEESAVAPRKVRDELLEQILHTAIDIVGGTTGIFAMPSFEHDGLDVVVRLHGATGPDRISYGEGTTGACALQGYVQVIPDSQDPSTYPPGVQPILRVKGSRSELAYPVQDSEGRLLGVIDLENEIASGAFIEEDATLVLQPLAQAATLVIQLTDSFAHLASIARLSRVLDDAQGQSDETIALVVLDEVREVTGAFAATARVPDQRRDSLVQLAHSGEHGRWTGLSIPLDRESAATSAYRDGKVVKIDDVRKTRTGHVVSRTARAEYLGSRSEIRSKIALPVTHHSQRIGVLDFDHRQPAAFVATEAYLRTVARQFGHALSARRDSQRQLVDKSHDMVKVLNAYYVKINHSIASRFMSIRHKLDDLESRLVEREVTLDADLREIYAIAETGIKDADQLLAASAGSYEDEQTFDVRRVLWSAVPDDRQEERFDLAIGVGEPVWVYGREQMLRWVFREIVNNSLKYGGSDVHVSVSLDVDATRGRAVAVLEDDGPGLPPEELRDLFTVRGRDSKLAREDRPKGGGMALVGARAFLETMRGTIEATPASPRGLRVTITLPIHRGAYSG